MSSETAIVIESASKSFGGLPAALDRISGEIRHGEITGLIGPDGAGKTTLIRLMTGLMLPDSGTLAVLGLDTRAAAPAIQANIGYMPQRFGLYEDLTVRENLDLFADLQGLPPEDRAAVFEQLLAFTSLAPFTRRAAGKLSGGMKQKLGLACALMKKPRVLLLDEPGVGVDPLSRRELWKMATALAGDGIAVVWATAYLDEAEKCGRVLLLNGGRLLYAGSPADLTDRMKGRVFRVSECMGGKRNFLTRLLDEKNVLDGTIQGDAIRLVMKEGSPPDNLPEDVAASPINPRFEDAFIDILGGGPGGRSRLAEATAELPRGEARPVIEAYGLTKRFGEFAAASDIGFTVSRGEIFGLLGPNGAGKTTTFKMMCGLLRPTSGTGAVAGIDLGRNRAAARNRLGYMAQKFSLYGDLSVRQNLVFFAGAYGLGRALRRRRVELMLDVFDLRPLAGQSARNLPLGLKQRLALACAVMHEPAALFLDEPTSGVDPVARREFWNHINGLVEKGVSVLVTTHFMDEAEYCDRVMLIHRGKAVAAGTPDQLKVMAKSPESPNPGMEDAFIFLLERDGEREESA